MNTQAPRPLWRLLCAGALFAGALYLRMCAARQVHPVDDAFITYRYAAKIAGGAGFVYNEGERVLGTTTPLYTLLLAGLGRLGVEIPAAGVALAVFASALCCALLFEILCVTTGSIAIALAGAALLALSHHQCWVAASGMETALLGVLMLGSYRLLVAGRPAAGGLLAGLAAITRPEGLLWLLLYLPFLREGRRWRWRALLPAALPTLAWLVFATCYFGSPVPQSVTAKMLFGRSLLSSPAATLAVLMAPLGCPQFALPLAALGALNAWRRDRRLLLPLGFGILFGAAYASGRPMVFPWYSGPLDLCFCLVAGSALASVWPPPGCLLKGERRPVRLAATALLIVCCVALLQTRRGIFVGPLRPEWHRLAADWIRAHTRPGDTVLVGDIGYVGFYALDRRVVDAFGLVWHAPEPSGREGQPQQIVADLFARSIPAARPDLMWLMPAQGASIALPGYRQVSAPGVEGLMVIRGEPADPR